MSADPAAAADHFAKALAALGFAGDPEMIRTPGLVAGFLGDFLPREAPSVTPMPTTSEDLVVLRDLPFYSLCAHHLLPFFGTCTIAVRPAGALAGLGWYPRVLQALSRRPQVQERLAAQLADHLHDAIGARSVGVRLVARQLCVEMRGARSCGSFEVTALRGAEDPDLRGALHRAP